MAEPRSIDIATLRELAGQEVAVSDWIQIDQTLIDNFAVVTRDPQWIHTDPQRAKLESPFKTTIAHGFLTLSMLSVLFESSVSIQGRSTSTNYGFNRVRFVSPVLSGEFVRASFLLSSISDTRPFQVVWQVKVERKDVEKPALVAEWLMRWD